MRSRKSNASDGALDEGRAGIVAQRVDPVTLGFDEELEGVAEL